MNSAYCLFVTSSCVLGLFLTEATADVPPLDFYSTGPGQGNSDDVQFNRPGKGMCDVWQSRFNAWNMDPDVDADQDGMTNYQESAAGTDPKDAKKRLALSSSQVLGSNVSFTIPTEIGKKYTLQEADSPIGPFVDASGSGASLIATVVTSTLTTPRPSGPNRKFYQIRVEDVDSDGDGVPDWAEGQLGSSPAVAENTGVGYNYGDVVHSMLSLQMTAVQDSGYERADKTVSSPTAVPARLGLVRTWPPVGHSVPRMPLNGIVLRGGAGAPSAQKADAVAPGTAGADYALPSTVSIPAGQGVPGTPFEVQVTPIQDAAEEVPEFATITATIPGITNASGPSAVVEIGDANPTLPANQQLYVAFLGREAGITSTASGYATALVNGDNTAASISLNFSNLSSLQNTAYIRYGTENDLAPALPLGQVSGHPYNIVFKPGLISTDQGFLNALKDGHIWCAVTSANFPDKEIIGKFVKATGSTTFDSNSPTLTAPNLGSNAWQTAMNEQIERDIWRFMTQATFGGTTPLYQEIRAKVDARITALGAGPTPQAVSAAYLQGLEDWMDEQINPTITPSVNFTTLVMAADNEEFALRGNKPITFVSDPQFNGVAYNVTYDANGVPTISQTADTNRPGNNYPQNGPNRRREWWTMILQSRDQLRQRMALALSEILVISEADETISTRHYGCSNYWDMLAAGAFGKYRNLLEQVSYSPMMGVYLSHIANRSVYEASPGVWVSPDENYAREIMQLFSIGLVLRHPDGSLVLDSMGLPIATYDQNDITELARVMTGWSHGKRLSIAYVSQWNGTTLTWNHQSGQRVGGNVLENGASANSQWFGRDDGHNFWQTPWLEPMKLMGRIGTTIYHDFNQYVNPADDLPVAGVSKRLLAGKHGQYDIPMRGGLPTATGFSNDVIYHNTAKLDMDEAHNALAGIPSAAVYPEPGQVSQTNPGHTNTPINISRWLIQRLVTSNPSSGYIYRVQKRYRETNGNLGAVCKAILLDYEARSLQLADSSIAHGKVKEPLVALAGLLRAYRAFSGAPVSILRDNPPPFSATDSPLAGAYPSGEFTKFSAQNMNPPSLPAGWAPGPFRFRFNDLTGNIGQSPQRAPSVFNWFLPDFVKPGAMAENGLFAPELQIATESNDVAKINFMYNYAWSNPVGSTTQPGSDASISDFTLSNNSATAAAFFSVNGQVTSSLTFNSSNWSTGQTVTVTAANDSVLTNLNNGLLRFNVSGAATGYDGIVQPPEPLSVLDDEKPNEALLITATSFSTWVREAGAEDQVNIRLSAPPPSGSTITVNVAANAGQVTVRPSSLTFTSANWSADQAVTVTAVNDTTVENAGSANDTLTFTSSAPTAANFNGLTASHLVNVIDNDNGIGLVITETSGGTAVSEVSGTDTYSVRLASAPTGTVTVTATAPATPGTSINNLYLGASGTSTTQTLTFNSTNWNTDQTVTVRANAEGSAEGSYPANPLHIGRITHSASGTGYTLTTAQAQTLGVPITDANERIIFTHTGGETRVSEDGSITDTFTVRLRTAPTTNVTVSLGSNTVVCEPSSLVFTPANFGTNQTVTVRAVDDSDRQGLRSAWVQNVIPLQATATATISGGVVTGFSITQAGAGYSSQPRVSIGGGGGSGVNGYALVASDGTISGIQVVSAGSGHTSAPAVTIDPPPHGGGFIVASATSDNSADSNYNNYWSFTHSAISVTILDNDLVGLVVTETDGSTEVNEGNSTDTYALSLASRPSSDVTVNIAPVLNTSVPPTGQVVTNVSSVTFTPLNWNTPQTVTVSGFNDSTVEGDLTTLIYHTLQSNDRSYHGLRTTPVSVMVVDNDNLPLTITHLDGYTALAEGGTALPTTIASGWIYSGDRFNVRLPVAPSSNVNVTIVSDSNQVIVSPSTLTFTNANGTTDQTVTVTAVDDALNEGNPNLTSLRFILSSTDVRYNNPPVDTLMIPIWDNDTPGLVVGETDAGTNITLPFGGSTRITEGTTDTFLVCLNRAPTSNVVVNVASANTADLTVSAASLTFTPANWNTRQTITVTALNDQIVEPRESVNVTLSVASGSSSEYLTAANQTVANWIVDNPRRNESLVIIQTGNTSFVAEGGKSDTVQFYLSARPEAPVTVSIDSNTQLTFDKTTFVFTSQNWNEPQSVAVSAVDDFSVEYNHSSNIQFRCNATPGGGLLLPGDARWTFVNPTSAVNIVDNEAAGVVIEESAGDTRTTEGNATTDTYTVRLSRVPNGNVVVTPVSASTSVGQTISPATLTFTPSNWNQPQTVTVTVVDDASLEVYTTTLLNQANIHTSNITHVITSASTDNGTHALSVTGASTMNGSRLVSCPSTVGLLAGMSISGTGIPAGATISSVDNHMQFTLSANATADGTGLSLTASTVGYSFVLTGGATTNASATVTVTSTAGLRTGLGITGTGILAGTTISAIPNATTLTLSQNANATASGLSFLAFPTAQTVTNFITDNDFRVIARHTGLETRVHEDGSVSDTYEVVLRNAPTAAVTVTPSVSGSTFAAQGLSISPATLSFGPADWSTPKLFTLSGVNNTTNDRFRTPDIIHTSSSTDSNYNITNTANIPSIRVQTVALDVPQIVLYESGSTTVLTEGGQTDDYFIGLSHAPTSAVTVTVQADAQTELAEVALPGALTVYSNALTLTFTSNDWAIKRVLVRAVDDLVADSSPHVSTITHSSASSDSRYSALAVASIPCFITDNDYSGVRVIPSGGSTLLSEVGGTDQYLVRLTRAPSADVSISITPDAQTQVVSPAGGVLTFTNSNWNLPQSVVLTAVNDTAIEAAHTSTITHTSASSDASYQGIGVPLVTANITDNDGPQLVITHSGGSTVVTEGNSTDTFTIRLNQAPTGAGNVTVTLIPPLTILPVPPYAKQVGYYTSDLGGSNQNRERVVLDFAETIQLYRDTFYAHLSTVYGSGGIPPQPAEVDLQNAHWNATKALIDKLDIWFCGGGLKARNPVLIEPNLAAPVPLPGPNPRQVIMDCIYMHSGGNNNLSTTRYEPEVVFNPKNPPNTTFANEVRDRARWAAYLMSTVMPGFVQH